MSSDFFIFDRNLLLKKRSSLAHILNKSDFLIKHSLQDILERLASMNREFPLILNMGSKTGYGLEELSLRPGTKQIIDTDLSFKLIKLNTNPYKIVMDEENIPFKENKFDLIISVLNFHLINDLPGCLMQLKNILKPGGVLIASLFGERNLPELRETLIKTEIECLNGISARVMPAIEIKQLGSLLQRAGFSMPVIDKETITVIYDHPLKLLYDIKNMGEGNFLTSRNKKYVGRRFWPKFCENYITNYSDFEKNILASFEILTLTAIR